MKASRCLASPNVQRIYDRRGLVAPQRARRLEPYWRRRVEHGHAHAAAELDEHDMHGRRNADDAQLRARKPRLDSQHPHSPSVIS